MLLPTQSAEGTVGAVAAWLPDEQADAWQDAVAAIPHTAQLGTLLLRLVAETDSGSGEKLASEVGDEVPVWLANPDELFQTIAPSIRLAGAERCFLAERYDACLAWTEGIDPRATYSPALVGYLRTVATYCTVDQAAAQKELELLEEEDADALGLARREVLGQIRAELAVESQPPLKVAARRMQDIERRLALGHGDQATQDQQQRVLDTLDTLIEELEEQKKQQQACKPGAGNPSGTPADKSLPGELKGPGQVRRQRFSGGDPWGALSPAERERLTQGLQRDFPGHYRELIQGYFENLAEGQERDDDGANSGGTP